MTSNSWQVGFGCGDPKIKLYLIDKKTSTPVILVIAMYLQLKSILTGRVKRSLALVAFAFFLNCGGSSAFAESMTLELVDGTLYTEVLIKRSLPTTVSFKHSEGFATVPAGALTDESLSKLGLNPADNPEFKEQREEMALKENLKVLKKKRSTIPGGIGTGQVIKTKNIEDINPVTILVVEDEVPRRVEIVTLPKEIQQELGYDPAKAASYIKNKTDAETQASINATKAALAQEKADAEAAKKKAEQEKKDAASQKTATVKEDPYKWSAVKPVTK